MSDLIDKNFNPGILHPFYFIRKGLYKAIFNHAPQLTGIMMDFGSGSKPYKPLFNVIKYVGVDYDGEGHLHDNEEIDVFYDGKYIPFNNDYFDSVFSSEVFEHIFNLEEILPEIVRVMKPGAKILITCPFVWNEHEIPVDYARYTQFALRNLFEKNGLRILVMDKSGNFITTLVQMWIVYLTQHIMPKFGIFLRFYPSRFVLKIIFVAMPNLAGVLLNKIMPARNDLYQTNVVLAQK